MLTLIDKLQNVKRYSVVADLVQFTEIEPIIQEMRIKYTQTEHNEEGESGNTEAQSDKTGTEGTEAKDNTQEEGGKTPVAQSVDRPAEEQGHKTDKDVPKPVEETKVEQNDNKGAKNSERKPETVNETTEQNSIQRSIKYLTGLIEEAQRGVEKLKKIAEE
jgi:hypothetical protein